MAEEALLTMVFGAVVLFFSERKLKEESIKTSYFAVCAGVLFAAAFISHLLMGYHSEGFSTDIGTFKSWAGIVNDVGFENIYQQDIFIDYPPGYLYVLDFLEKIRIFLNIPSVSQGFTLMIKLPSIIADMACGGVLLWLTEKKMGKKTALFVTTAYLFCPAVFINSAQWGQADSFCTAILLVSVALLYKGYYIPSGLLYGVAVICKPQMLIFAPLYLFFAIKEKKWIKLLIGIVCALGAIILLALPFTKGFNFLWLIRKYQSTLNYYDYYSVNAYNFFTLIGWNWKPMPQGIAKTLLTLAAPVAATAACGALVFLSKRKDALFACPVVLMSVMYVFGVKMHERYLFPAFLFLLLSFVLTRDKRLLRSYAVVTCANYLNVSYVMYLFQIHGGNYDPRSFIARFLSAVQILAIGYVLYAVYSVYVQGKVVEASERAPLSEEKKLHFPEKERAKLHLLDVLLMLGITVIYGFFAFWRLGGTEMPATSWSPSEGESVVIRAGENGDVLRYLPGLVPDDSHYAAKTGVNLRVETSTDGVRWINCGELSDSGVYSWQSFELETPGKLVRLTALSDKVAINEIGLQREGYYELLKLSSENENAAPLLDEQETVPLFRTYENSTYFDEIYHARTAYEHILDLEPYENTHPPLGKYIISIGIRLFGMNPFGWRFMGTLFGVLMLPVLYHLIKQLFGKSWLSALGTILFAFDFMHFTQTRISTIDTYAVFFLLLMYDAMVGFLRYDILRTKMRKLLVPLGLCGLFMGLGIASKWTAAYGAVGLAALYFGKLFFTWKNAVEEEKGQALKMAIKLCLWCCLFFIAIPFAIYFAVYLPITTLPHNSGNVLWAFGNYQKTMFNYHSNLVAEHYFSSPWYEWPLDIQPIWYFSGDPVNIQGDYSSISAFGNPLLWWSLIPSFCFSVWLCLKRKSPACAVAIVGFLSVYLPWVLVSRLTFIYHYFTAIPFLLITLLAAFDFLSERGALSKKLSLGSKLGNNIALTPASAALGVFTLICLGLFAIYFPVISGAPTTKAYADMLEIFSSWYF